MATTFIAQKLRPGSRTPPGATTIKQADRINPLNGGVIKGQYLRPGQTASANINYRGMGPGSQTVARPSFRNSAEYYGARDQFVGNPLDNLQLTNNGTPHSWDPAGTPSQLQQAMAARMNYRGGMGGGYRGHSMGANAFDEGFDDGAADVMAEQWAADEPVYNGPGPMQQPVQTMRRPASVPLRGAAPYNTMGPMRGMRQDFPKLPPTQYRRPYLSR